MFRYIQVIYSYSALKLEKAFRLSGVRQFRLTQITKACKYGELADHKNWSVTDRFSPYTDSVIDRFTVYRNRCFAISLPAEYIDLETRIWRANRNYNITNLALCVVFANNIHN